MLETLKETNHWPTLCGKEGETFLAQSAFGSNSLRKASQPFLSMTPSSAKLFRTSDIADRWNQKENKLTVAVRVGHDDISCSKLDEKLLYEFQRGVDADS